MPFWSKTCEKDMAVMDAGAKKDLTSFVEGMDRKKKELLGTRESKFPPSSTRPTTKPTTDVNSTDSTPPFSHLQHFSPLQIGIEVNSPLAHLSVRNAQSPAVAPAWTDGPHQVKTSFQMRVQ